MIPRSEAPPAAKASPEKAHHSAAVCQFSPISWDMLCYLLHMFTDLVGILVHMLCRLQSGERENLRKGSMVHSSTLKTKILLQRFMLMQINIRGASGHEEGS